MTRSSQSAPRAFVAGWPVAHSRSPLIHRYWLKELGIEGAYDPVAVAPKEVDEFFQNLVKSSEFIGGNVTIPHKEAAFRACALVTDTARRLGAVNTLWIENNQLRGDNTDGAGFTANLDQNAEGWDANPGRAVVIGAGGAARAVLVALEARGFEQIRIVNRTRPKAEALARFLGMELEVLPWENRTRALADATFLVNTTSLGMTGQPPLDLDLSALAETALVTDIVYSPLRTGLLLEAAQKRLQIVDGLGMLLHQAAPGFARWFGKVPQVTEKLRSVLLADLEA